MSFSEKWGGFPALSAFFCSDRAWLEKLPTSTPVPRVSYNVLLSCPRSTSDSDASAAVAAVTLEPSMASGTNVTQSADSAEPSSNIACHACRRRKVKCGKELPFCLRCQQSAQRCVYPEKAQRPGPKIGDTRGPGKRQAQSMLALTFSCLFESNLPQGSRFENGVQPEARRQRISDTACDSSGDRGQLQHPAVAQSPDVADATTWDARTMHNLAFLVHPSHESRSPEDRYSQTPGSVSQSTSEAFLADSCFALGVPRQKMDQL